MSSDEPYQDGIPWRRAGYKLVASGIKGDVTLTHEGCKALHAYWKKKGERPLPGKLAKHILDEFVP